MIESFLFCAFGSISSGLFGLWAGRCWQRAIDAEKTLDALALKYETVDNIDDEFEEVEQLLMDYAERLESPTAADLNEVLNETTTTDRSVTEPDPLRRDTQPVRESALPESSEAADTDSDNGEQAAGVREKTGYPSTEEEG